MITKQQLTDALITTWGTLEDAGDSLAVIMPVPKESSDARIMLTFSVFSDDAVDFAISGIPVETLDYFKETLKCLLSISAVEDNFKPYENSDIRIFIQTDVDTGLVVKCIIYCELNYK